MTTVAVIDFETTGLSPAMGDRATEIAIVIMEGDRVVDRYQSLMNAGVRISSFIEAYTGISNEMIAAAPPAAQVMAEANRFVGARPMVAHNASFDRRFWCAELERLGQAGDQPFACTLLLARRLYPEARSFRLGALASFHALPSNGRAHRALADAETAAALFGRIRHDLRARYGVPEPRHALLMQLQACSRKALPKAIERHLAGAAGPALRPIAVRA
ncbi:3'-5' exonuclease [Ramlibacter sp.]|uniref:3'-5' exonuclease n=1 Tax=Ramlibacter sp. TaxID=1917967 RepID=UPI002BFBD2CC|nr:3'-5' exonuclease [Ramlibacter sp.]HWI83504.1 3'-5' exonuclease [Ramlibacter sp.]